MPRWIGVVCCSDRSRRKEIKLGGKARNRPGGSLILANICKTRLQWSSKSRHSNLFRSNPR
jgi:hypothetical protein